MCYSYKKNMHYSKDFGQTFDYFFSKVLDVDKLIPVISICGYGFFAGMFCLASIFVWECSGSVVEYLT